MQTTPSSEWHRAVKIELPNYGCFELSRIFVGDFEIFRALKKQSLTPREFAVHIVSLKLVNPKFDIDTVRSWSDEQLILILKNWSQATDVIWDEDTSQTSFEVFQQAYERHWAEWALRFTEATKLHIDQFSRQFSETLKPFFAEITGVISPTLTTFPWVEYENQMAIDLGKAIVGFDGITTAFNQSIQQSIQALVGRADIQIGQIFSNTPVFSEVVALIQEVEEADPLIEALGYGFVLDFDELAFSFLYDLAQVKQINPKVQNAVITRKLLVFTCSQDFESDLRDNFQNSFVLKRRWRIIEIALAAHRRREYLLSIPPLFAQLEGTYTDLLILKEMAIRGLEKKGNKSRKKLFVAEGGKYKLNSDKKRIKLDGLGQLVTQTSLKDDPDFKRVADCLSNQLAPKRNGILHGRVTAYEKAKYSVQALLLLLVLSNEIAALERGEIVL
jgi:hypothetical protein